jgi:hypothetical protein
MVDINNLPNTSVKDEGIKGNFDPDTRSRYKDKEPVKKKKKNHTHLDLRKSDLTRK